MYAKCGALKKAHEVFEGLPSRNVVSWNTLISGFVQREYVKDALNSFEQMQHEGLNPDAVTFACILKACGNSGALNKGESLHFDIAKLGLLDGNVVLGGALVDMYSKCCAFSKAQEVLEGLSSWNVVLWNALITGYVQADCNKEALNCFEWMQHDGVSPNAVTFLCILKACGNIGALDVGVKIHSEIVRQRLLSTDAVLGSALVDMYAKCGALVKAKEVLECLPFRNVIPWSALLAGYAQAECGNEALKCFEEMWHEGIFPDAVTFACVLKVCGSMGALDTGECIHLDIIRHEILGGNVVLGNALVDMYMKCGALSKAQEVFEGILLRNVALWNALITGYAEAEHGKQALNCYQQMQHEGLSPDDITFICILRACGSIGALDKGKTIHSEISRQGLLAGNLVVCNALITMYVKCGVLMAAKDLLDGLPVRNVVSWNAIITGYVEEVYEKEALNSFEQMQCEGLLPDTVTFACILNACGNIGALNAGENIHSEIVRHGLLDANVVLGGALVDMYSSCGALTRAKSVLVALPAQNVICWNALIAGCVHGGYAEEALNCFKQMQCEDLSADAVTFSCILKACANARSFDEGHNVHLQIARQGLLHGNVVLGNALVYMYAKCGAFEESKEVFEGLSVRDVIVWSALIACYSQAERHQEALSYFKWMQMEGIIPNTITFVCILRLCGCIGALEQGESTHFQILKQGLLDWNAILGNALVDMYARCGALLKAKNTLEGLSIRDVVTWNSMIAGCAHEQHSKEALNCYEEMQWEGVYPDEITFICLLKACGSLGAIDKGEAIHFEIIRRGLLGGNVVLGNALVGMYAKCGEVEKARDVLEELTVRNVASWSALITGYLKEDYGIEVLNCFERMLGEGLSPDEISFIYVLKACGNIGVLGMGESVHSEIIRQGLLDKNIILGGSLVDMYAKCGAVLKARKALDGLPLRDVISWNALMARYAQGECGKDALNCLEQMQCEGLRPNEITFLCMLNICSLSGLLDEGGKYFMEMTLDYGIVASSEHHACMVYLFARVGLFDRAIAVIDKMPASDAHAAWHAFMTACKKWGNVRLGIWAFEQLDSKDSLSDEHCYADIGMLNNQGHCDHICTLCSSSLHVGMGHKHTCIYTLTTCAQ